jgi:hypothetical protein
MTARQYARIEALLEQAEAVTTEHPLLTQRGREIQAIIADTLMKVTAERIRADTRDSSPPIPTPENTNHASA